ncbi:hypothetical protein MNEG_8830 [Monoraphidium neglectum]|uniref:SHSP domain-containing protein n=1 Tax=Monoraphidium neglectum TaxID=145388 RepID=A0A0D2M6Z3_9CHLO|nr:hypothetical protein MNEG_8830 [Monoraphidium neglectum]KIY99134.1 hypothetical protein MNEG_8830 [Monoraphidium neglectum]|eukprot:XP_013898154.1 hypothetical protein MNEG_8830 [Monoraphidium neglectum]
MQTLASRSAVGRSTVLNRRDAQRRPSRVAAPRSGKVVLVAPRAYYGAPGCGPYGPNSEQARQARRMMEEMARQWGGAMRNGGFSFPGGRAWFGAEGNCGNAAEGADGPSSADQADAPAWQLAVDLIKESDSYIITADVPGVSKADLTIKLLAPAPPKQPSAVLLLRGTRQASAVAADEGADVQATPLMCERRRGAFERRVRLPEDAATTGINARVKDGVLMVRVPRVPKVEPLESDIPIA